MMALRPTRTQAGYLALLVLLLALPSLGAYPVFVMKVLCFALFACAFNLLIGYTGLLSFGHASFFGGAAYAAGYALKVWGWPTPLGLAFGVAVAAALGLVFGWLSIRRAGIYLTMITLALAQMVYFFCLQAPFTGGEDGLQSVPRGTLLGLGLEDDLRLYFVVVGTFGLGFLAIHRIVHSPFGQVLQAIRENEPRAISLGYDVNRFKLLAFVLSAGLAGLAGGLKTTVLGFATLTDVVWTTSGAVVLMTLVGGMGTLVGPIVGAAVIVSLESKVGDLGTWLARTTGVEWFAGLGESVTIVTGLIFVLSVSLFRAGLVGELAALVRRLEARRSASVR
jgi:branched-chain amino acid transport system permease protein